MQIGRHKSDFEGCQKVLAGNDWKVMATQDENKNKIYWTKYTKYSKKQTA